MVYDNKRNSVRIASVDSFGVGSLWVADMYHVPYGVRTLIFCQDVDALKLVSDLVLRVARVVEVSYWREHLTIQMLIES